MIDLTVKTLDSRNHAFSLEDDQITVRGFKEYIAEFVAVPADSQRLIYCGRVLQDEKKLNDYDVNGKVIHLVQRAPPQPGQRGNDGALGQAQRGEPVWQTLQRTYYRLTRAQMHGNATYVGAMSVPAEIVEGHELPVPQLSNTLSNSRLIVARRMLNRANELMSRLDDPNCPLNPPASESNQPSLAQQVQVQELETEHEYDNEGRNNYGDRLLEAVVAAALSVAEANNVTLFRGNNDDSGESTETRAGNDSNDDSQSDTQQQQPQQPQQQQQQQQPQQPQQQQQQQQQGEQQGSTSNGAGQSNRPQTLTPPPPRPPQMAELLERVLEAQTLLRPYLERYRVLMHADPSLPPGAGPDGVEGNQRIIDGVSETLHYMSHAFHALSDIIVDMGQQPPRNLRCRPIIIQHSAILQPNIPIQVEAHISLHGRNAVNNNGNEETADSASTVGQSESGEGNAEDSSQQQGSENASQQQSEQQPQPEPRASPFGTVFNLPNNVEVLMEVSPEGNIDSASGGEQPQTGENNNNTNNVGSMSGGDTFPWGAAGSPPDFIRNLIQAVAADVQQSNITATTITSRNPSSTNSAQSTQARSNVGTHPTTATQTRSTSRPHVFHHQQTYPLGIGMTIGQGLDFDPFLPCNSHHVHRTSTTTSSTVTSASQGTRASQVSVSETPTPAQTATTSTTANNTGSTNTTASTTSQTNASNNPLINLQQQILGGTSGQPLAGILNSNSPDLAELVMQMLDDENIHVAIIGNRGRRTLAELFGSGAGVDLFAPQNSTNQGNFLTNLSVLVAQNMTLEGTIRLRIGQWEPIASLRRPLQDFLQHSFPNTTTEGVQEQATEMLLSQFRPYFQNLLTADEDGSNGNSAHIDVCATIESLLRPCIKEILRLLFNNDVDDARFGQEILNSVNQLGKQLCAVLRYCIRGGQADLETVAWRFASGMLEDLRPPYRYWMFHGFIPYFRTYSSRIPQPPDSEILPLLVYKDAPTQTSMRPSTPAHQPAQAQSEAEPMETETTEERTTNFDSLDDGEEIPETFPGHETLPSDWVPIIARDGVRQRRQLQMQGMANGGVATFSDAYLGVLPTKRRKVIEQKPRLLVSPTPNHSAITASMERLVREGVSHAGVEEVDGAAAAVAVDPGVRRAFGQAIRDCLNPRRYGTPDFPDPLRFPNATKYFADQERSQK